ncbi:MAG TPA: polysaccharide deacetylase family protein [Chryseosolibacter sp.]|nr:polysaccharide deacetylase family protein [Chryseosolibacter sp.]
MKKIIFILVLSAATGTLSGQQPIRLIIRGDDMGFSHSGNMAIVKAFREGIVRSVEVIVPSPWFPEAVELLKQNPGIDVGIHLAITSEWDKIKWRPLTDCPSLRDEDGYFFPMIYPNKNYPQRSVMENQWRLEDIEKEFRAQIELALKKIRGITHISGHMNSTAFTPEVKALARRLAQEYRIHIDPEDHQVIPMGYGGQAAGTSKQKIKSFIGVIHSLQPGNTYLFVDHPGLDNDELRAISHIGYENVATDRQGVTDLFTSREVIQLIREKKIQLISYKDLKP